MLLLQIDEHEPQLFELRNTKSHNPKIAFIIYISRLCCRIKTRNEWHATICGIKKASLCFSTLKQKQQTYDAEINCFFLDFSFRRNVIEFRISFGHCALSPGIESIRCARASTRSYHFNEWVYSVESIRAINAGTRVVPFLPSWKRVSHRIAPSISCYLPLCWTCSSRFQRSEKIVLIRTI